MKLLRPSQFKQHGTTLIELMIGLSIVAIVLIVAVPSAQHIIIQNRVVSQINELSAVVQFARATAIDEQVETIVCPTSDFTNCTTNWSQAVIKFQANGAVNSATTLLICHKDKEAKYARALILSLQGRVKVSRDSDQDGVHEDNSGTDLSCN